MPIYDIQYWIMLLLYCVTVGFLGSSHGRAVYFFIESIDGKEFHLAIQVHRHRRYAGKYLLFSSCDYYWHYALLSFVKDLIISLYVTFCVIK